MDTWVMGHGSKGSWKLAGYARLLYKGSVFFIFYYFEAL